MAQQEQAPSGTDSKQPKDLDVGEYAESFGALKTSMSQGRDLRKRKADLKAYREQTAKDKATYEDEANILANYDQIVGEQRDLIASTQHERDVQTEHMDRLNADLAQAKGDLATTRSHDESALADLKRELDAKVKASESAYDQAKRANEQAKTRHEQSQGTSSESEMLEVLERSDQQRAAAKDAFKSERDTAKRAYKKQKDAFDKAEKPLETKVGKLEDEVKQLGAAITRNRGAIAAAQQRVAYCEQVHDDPARVETLKAEIERREEQAQLMQADIDALADRRAEVKKSTGKAKGALIALAVLVAIVIVAIVVVTTRGF